MAVQHFVNYFDTSNDGRLCFKDFLQIVLTCEKPVTRASASQRQNYAVSPREPFPALVEAKLFTLFQLELSLALTSEMLRQGLVSQFDFNLTTVYNQIDDVNLKWIDTTALKRFLSKCGVVSSQKLLISIIRRFDLEGNGRLNINEFNEAILPFEKFTKGSLEELKRRITDKLPTQKSSVITT